MNYLKKLIELPENLYYDIDSFFNNIKNEIVWGWERLFIGYDSRWHWSISDELTPILIDCLNYYKINKEGYPSDFKSKEEFNKTIDIIIDGFKAGRDLDYVGYKDFENSEEIVKEYKRLYKIKKKGLALFVKYYDCFWN